MDLRDRGELDLSETFIDGTFAAEKKGALKLEKPKRARGPRSWQSRIAQAFLRPLLSILIKIRYNSSLDNFFLYEW